MSDSNDNREVSKKRRGGPPPTGMEDRMHSGTVCTATRRDGSQCTNFAIKGATVCRMHGGSAPQVRRAAQVRLLMQADNLMGALLKIALNEKLPVQHRLVAIRDGLDRANLSGTQNVEVTVEKGKTFEELVEGAMVEVAETDDGEWFVQYADGTAKVLPADRVGGYSGSSSVGFINDLDMSEDVIDAEVVTDEDDDYEPPATRHDRRAFAEVEQGRAAERKRMASGGMSEAERRRLEADALAEVARSARTTADPTIARAAYEAALENGGTLAEAKAAGRAAAERATDTTGKRRARTSEATITTGSGERRKRK